MHVAAALDPVGGLLGVREFPATAAGYAGLLHWLAAFGDVALVGVEGTGSYGAGLARHLAAAGVRVVEVDRADRQDRHRAGKSDPLDAVSAARAAQSGRAAGAPKGRDGAVEAIRALMVAKRSARSERTQAINQARALIVTGPDDLRARCAGHTPAALVAELAAGDHPERLRSEAAWAHLCGVAPIPASSGKVSRHRPNRGGNREAKPCLVADRDHPHEFPPRHQRLRGPAHQGRPLQNRDHPLPEAVRRPRGLPPPARRRLTPPPSRGGLALSSAAAPSCWPSIDLPAAPGSLPAC